MFIDERLLDCVRYGSSFGLEYKTNITTMRSGVESRNAEWKYPKGRYSIDYNAVTPNEYIAIRDAWVVANGAHRAFRFKDWSDFIVKDQFIGFGSGETQEIQLFKRYSFGNYYKDRLIYLPILETLEMKVDDAIIPFAFLDKGKIEINVASGKEIKASFEFDVPVRFVEDKIMSDPLATRGNDRFIMNTGADLVEVIL